MESVLQTCDELIRLRVPNLLRLYLNPWVAQTCVALSAAVRWCFPGTGDSAYPSFLANSGDEALSGAIKLARFHQQRLLQAGGSCRLTEEIVLVGHDWPPAFATLEVIGEAARRDSGAEGLIPHVLQVELEELGGVVDIDGGVPCAVVMGFGLLKTAGARMAEALQRYRTQGGLLVVQVRARDFSELGGGIAELLADVVVFDDSMTAGEVPFGAFSARHDLYAPWMKGKYATFHSTTFQPNSISTRHFIRCLEQQLPELFATVREQLAGLLRDPKRLSTAYGELFSPSLLRVIRAAGLDDEDVTAFGAYVTAGERRLFDGIGGVACSLRGHNPPEWCAELRNLKTVDVRSELSEHLRMLTGLEHYVPAVSGASAVEAAMKMALTISFPRTHLVVMRGGYSGKTLVALSGTERGWYRDGLGKLYPHVIYVDPFGTDAAAALHEVLRSFPVAAIQLELVQGVGGVREIPGHVLSDLQELAERFEVPLIVDEIQTGMHRTGPFLRSSLTPLRPDFVAIGKGTSDMLFPCGFTLYSERVGAKLRERRSQLPEYLHNRFGYETAGRCMLNTLTRWAQDPIDSRVIAAGERYREQLTAALAHVTAVREVRVFGLLIGVELRQRRGLLNWAGLKPSQLYLLRMMQHSRFPLLMGYCQYEPGTLKFTPPLTVLAEEIDASVGTIRDALSCSQVGLLSGALRTLYRGWN